MIWNNSNQADIARRYDWTRGIPTTQQILYAQEDFWVIDALLDIMVVTAGAIHSMGADGEGGWKEVMRTNFAKIDRETGKVRKREDGKVLKPVGWTPPNLEPFVKKTSPFNKFS